MGDWLWAWAGVEARANELTTSEFIRLAVAHAVALSAARRGASWIGPGAELLDQARIVLDAIDQDA